MSTTIMTENKYINGKIYKIFNTINSEIYIGSTIETLSNRLIRHKCAARNKTSKFYKLMNELGAECFYIELVESYPCNNKTELNAREGYHIKQIATANERIAGRTFQEYYEDNRNNICEKKKHYYENNKDKRKQYNEDNKHIIAQKMKQYYEDSKDKRKQYLETNKDKINCKMQCPCGGVYSLHHKARHFKTMLHKQYVENDIII